MKSKFNNPGRSAWKPIPLLSALLLAGGCAVKPKMLAPNFAPPARIAVLPMANESNDLQGPEFVRQVFVRSMENRGYVIAPISETDELLKAKLAITDGGQMGSTTPQKVCAVLGVDAAVYGILLDFKFVNIGFYQNKFVEANFKMIAKDGQQLWEDQRKAARKEVQLNLKDAGDALARGLTEKMAGNLFNSPLSEQVHQLVRMAVSTLPRAN